MPKKRPRKRARKPAQNRAKKRHAPATAMKTEIDKMLDACDEDYRTTLHLPGFEDTVTVIVDSHLYYPVIAYMIENGQPFSEIIKELHRARFVRRKGEQWTPEAVEEIYLRHSQGDGGH